MTSRIFFTATVFTHADSLGQRDLHRPFLAARYSLLGFVAMLICTFSALAQAQPTRQQLDALYRRIEADKGLSIADKYEAKMQVLKSTLDAGNAYTEVFDKVQKYSLIAGDAGGMLRPETADALYKFSERLETANKNEVFEKFGNVVRAEGYVSDAVNLVSDIDKINRDTNLPSSAKRSLKALRAAGEAMEKASWVPLAGPVLETYGKCTKELTNAVSKTAENITKLKGGGFSLVEEKETLAGLEDGFYRRTPLFDKGIPVVREFINETGKERVYLQVEPGRWTEVTKRFDYDQVETIVADYNFLHDGGKPTPKEIVHYLTRPESRKDLASQALDHADLRIKQAMHKEVAPKMKFGAFLDAKEALEEKIEDLGLVIPPGSASFREILKAEIQKPGAYDVEFRRIALNTTPYAREYLRYKGITDPDKMSLDKLRDLLEGYRSGSQSKFVKWMAKNAGDDPFQGVRSGGISSREPVGGTEDESKKKEREEATKKLEARAKKLTAEGFPEKTAEERDKESKPIIPEDCTIQVATAYGKNTDTQTYFVRSGKVTGTAPDLKSPDRSGKDYRIEGPEFARRFEGSLHGNVIRGIWHEEANGHQSWHYNRGRLGLHTIEQRKRQRKTEIVLHLDHTCTITETGTEQQSHLKALVGVLDADTEMKESKRTSTWPGRPPGHGVWQYRK